MNVFPAGHMADNHSCLGYNTVEAADANCAPFNTFAQMRSHLPRYSEGAISGSANSSYQNRESYGGGTQKGSIYHPGFALMIF